MQFLFRTFISGSARVAIEPVHDDLENGESEFGLGCV